MTATDFTALQFDPKWHTYTLRGKRLTSVTKFCKQFATPFDREYWSNKKASERGITQAEILAEWDAKGKESRDKGTKVHEHIQRVLNGEPAVNEEDQFGAKQSLSRSRCL